MVDDAQGKQVAPDPTITITARQPSPIDPIEKVNVKTFKTVQSVDKAVIAPVADGYEQVVPKPVRNGLRNFFNNLREPVVAVNFLLQHRFGKAAETIGRFGINSTVGIGGVVDMAKRRPFNLRSRDNGFADTFAYYGVKSGPYLYLPLIGSTTPRDLTGVVMDRLFLPFAVGGPFAKVQYTLPASVVDQLDLRVRFDEQINTIRASDDPYLTRRTLYFEQRNAEICALHRSDWQGCQNPPAGSADKMTTQSDVTP